MVVHTIVRCIFIFHYPTILWIGIHAQISKFILLSLTLLIIGSSSILVRDEDPPSIIPMIIFVNTSPLVSSSISIFFINNPLISVNGVKHDITLVDEDAPLSLSSYSRSHFRSVRLSHYILVISYF